MPLSRTVGLARQSPARPLGLLVQPAWGTLLTLLQAIE